MKNKKYLVIGLYEDGQRYADEHLGATAEDAENEALKKADPGLTVAGTIELKKGLVISMAS